MDINKERKKVIQYIKNYYKEYRKTPSMKEILSGSEVNPRVFYALFDNQEEAFNLASVPYSDEARRKVEKANITRKYGKIGVIERRPLPPLKVINRDYVINKNDERYVNNVYLMKEKLSNIYSKLRQLNRNDQESIKIAYNALSSLIVNWNVFLSYKDQQYKDVKVLRDSTNPEKYNLPMLGYDLNDIEGSYNGMCEKEFNDLVLDYELIFWDMKHKEYFKMMLDEVFGSPPDFKIKG